MGLLKKVPSPKRIDGFLDQHFFVIAGPPERYSELEKAPQNVVII